MLVASQPQASTSAFPSVAEDEQKLNREEEEEMEDKGGDEGDENEGEIILIAADCALVENVLI